MPGRTCLSGASEVTWCAGKWEDTVSSVFGAKQLTSLVALDAKSAEFDVRCHCATCVTGAAAAQSHSDGHRLA
jgi:hypothetical protein